jgi:hypothetical protein
MSSAPRSVSTTIGRGDTGAPDGEARERASSSPPPAHPVNTRTNTRQTLTATT